jgi:hypothetical protein
MPLIDLLKQAHSENEIGMLMFMHHCEIYESVLFIPIMMNHDVG